MAYAADTVFVPVVERCMHESGSLDSVLPAGEQGDGVLYALDAATGAVRWSLASARRLRLRDRRERRRLRARARRHDPRLSTTTGKVLWQARAPRASTGARASPAACCSSARGAAIGRPRGDAELVAYGTALIDAYGYKRARIVGYAAASREAGEIVTEQNFETAGSERAARSREGNSRPPAREHRDRRARQDRADQARAGGARAAATCCSRTFPARRRRSSRARSRARSTAPPSRVQCTPDLQPTDVTGLSVYNQRTREFEFRPGPVFANILLVDEINRAMPKTQAALLEAMAERQVTVDGVTRRCPTRSSSWRRRTRSSRRGRSRCPRPSSTASSSRRSSATRASTRRSASCASSARATRSTTCSRSRRSTTSASWSARSRTSTPTSCSCAGSSSSSGDP